MDQHRGTPISSASKGPSMTNVDRSRQSKHVEGDDLELGREDLGRRHSFKRILDELDPMLSKTLTSTPTRLPPTSSAQATSLQQPSNNEALHSLLQATLQSSQNAQLQQALLTQLAGGGNNLSQIAAQHQLQQQLQQQLLLNLAGSGNSLSSNLSTNILSAALLGNSSTPPTGVVGGGSSAGGGPINPTTSPQAASMPTGNLISSSPTSSLGSPDASQNSLAPEHFGEDTMRKRETRLKKNREAARECRRKKKEYVRCLENRVAVLESQNQALIGELRALKELYLPKSDQA